MTQAIRELTKVRQRLHDQLHELQVEVDAIEKAINVLDREDQNDGSASTNKEFAKTGFADGCRSIVGSEFITPLEVRDRLIRGGFKHKSKSKVLGGVYATLKRLAGPKGPFDVGARDGRKVYRMKQTPEQAAA